MRTTLLLTLLSTSLFAQSPSVTGKDVPTVITFVAPAYPRAAKDQRKMGKTITRIKVSPEGSVKEVKTVSANAVFENYVLEALKQWRFQPSEKEHILEVTCSFEFIQDECDGTNEHPITSETYVSAELPTVVHIKTGLQCMETHVSQRQH
ncbi:MAG TPA: energy transducer TonB [Candidatus Sulfotelmatobacter sp.]|nr:energy transducer TonB [Candidatus Sulfotelmatobacter sp.]